jgi:hypothetical protein
MNDRFQYFVHAFAVFGADENRFVRINVENRVNLFFRAFDYSAG